MSRVFATAYRIIVLATCYATGDSALGAEQTTRTPVELVPQFAHTDRINAIAVSPDGQLIATGGTDLAIRLWDATTRKQLMTLSGHTNHILSLAFSPDSRHLISGSQDRTCKLWDVGLGVAIREFDVGNAPKDPLAHYMTPRNDFVREVSVSSDGSTLLITTDSVSLWNMASGQRICILGRYGIAHAAYSPDGRFVAAGASTSTVVTLLDVKSRAVVRTFTPGRTTGGVLAIAFARDGKTLLCTGDQGFGTRVWDVESGKELFSMRGLTGPSACSPNGQLCVSTNNLDDYKQQLVLWNPTSGKELRRLDLWDDIATVKGVKAFQKRLESRCTDIAFIGNGAGIIAASRRVLTYIDTTTGNLLSRSSDVDVDVAGCLAVAPNDHRIVAGRRHKQVSLTPTSPLVWDLATASTVCRLEGSFERIRSLSFSKDGAHIFGHGDDFGDSGSFIGLWDAYTGKELKRFKPSRDFPPRERVVTGAAVASDGQSLFTSHTEYVCQREMETGKEIRRIKTKTNAAAAMVVSDDGRFLLVGSRHHSPAELFEVATGAPLRSFAQPKEGHGADHDVSLAFSSDGKHVLVGHCLFERETGTRLHQFPNSTSPAALAPDVKSMVVTLAEMESTAVSGVSVGRTIIQWDVATGREMRRFAGHSGWVTDVKFSHDGQFLISSSLDGTTRVWSVSTGAELIKMITSDAGAFSATPENYYQAVPKTAVLNVGFRVGLRAFAFDQFDLRFNRPDVILDRIGLVAKEKVEMYRQAYQRRLTRAGFNENALGGDQHLPEIAVSELPLSTRNKQMQLNIRASDVGESLDRINVYVNGVPWRDINGISLKSADSNTWTGAIALELSAGSNVIEVSVTNSRGVRSLPFSREVICDHETTNRPQLYAVVVGVSEYRDDRFRLSFAHKDAADLSELLERNSKSFEQAHVLRIIDGDATRENVLKAKSHLMQAGVDDLAIVFFAGHGVLDAKHEYYFGTSDLNFENPVTRGISYDTMESLLDGLRARKKILMIDTCHSGEVDEDAVPPMQSAFPEGEVRGRIVRGAKRLNEGIKTNRMTSDLLRELFADLRRNTGAVIISASGGMEFAVESTKWSNGVFTFAVLRGLGERKADGNGDGRIQVSELRDFVIAEVSRLTGGRQTPMIRRENLQFDFLLD